MNQREQLELAAKACGYVIEDSTIGDGVWAYPVGAERNWEGDLPTFKWHPGKDQADSDRMACKLRIDRQVITSKSVLCVKLGSPGKGIEAKVAHNGTDEDVCRAVREARMLVAAEIGGRNAPLRTMGT